MYWGCECPISSQAQDTHLRWITPHVATHTHTHTSESNKRRMLRGLGAAVCVCQVYHAPVGAACRIFEVAYPPLWKLSSEPRYVPPEAIITDANGAAANMHV